MESSIHILRREPAPGGWRFFVEIGSVNDRANYEVVLERSFAEEVTGYRFRNEDDVETFIKRSFLFLLEREPKSAILSSFNVRDIGGFFPEYAYIMKNET